MNCLNEHLSAFSDEICKDLAEQLCSLQKLGIAQACIRSYNGKNIVDYSAAEFATDALPLLEKYHIAVSSIGSPIGKIFLDDEEGFARQLEQLESLCKISVLCGCRFIRMFSFYMQANVDFQAASETVICKLNQFLEIAARYEITLLHENEKDIFGDSAQRCLFLAQQLDSAHFALIFDFANFVQCGENPLEAYDLLRPYIRDFHIKDALASTGETVVCGMGNGQIAEILKLAGNGGFSELLTLEPHLVLFDGLRGLELSDAKDIIKTDKALDGYDGFVLQINGLRTCLPTGLV